MRIIKINKIERIHKCEKCKSVYSYLPSEVDYFLSPTVRCPVCNGLNFISIFDKKVKNIRRNKK